MLHAYNTCPLVINIALMVILTVYFEMKIFQHYIFTFHYMFMKAVHVNQSLVVKVLDSIYYATCV